VDDKRSVGLMIKTASCCLEKKVNQEMKEEDLTSSQFGVLRLLSGEGQALPMKELEKSLHISQPTALGLVRRLEPKGYVTTRTSEKDRRVLLVEITKKGQAVCNRARQHALETEAQMLSGMSDSEKDFLRDLLWRLLENVYHVTPKEGGESDVSCEDTAS